jgi:YegS/Rv2252/BmrU family lipid kinase
MMLDPERTLVIANPAARGGWVEKNWADLERRIRDGLGPVRFAKTERAGDAAAFAARAADEGVESVISYGGDGTHGEVAHGLMQRPEARRPSLGILHAGTGGDFRKLIVDGHDLDAACRTIAREPAVPIDVGHVEFEGDDGAPASRYFINLASLGMSGLIDRYVNRSGKKLGGTLSFALASVRAQATYAPPRVHLEIDGRVIGEYTIHVICVGNGRYAGGGMKFAPDARLADGLFDVVVIEAAPLRRSLPVGVGLYTGRHLRSPLVHHARGCEVRVAPVDGRKAFMDIDGEAPGVAPATFRAIPGALRLHGARREVL